MKKIISIMLLVAMAFTTLPQCTYKVFASEAENPTITVENQSANPGDTVTVNVSIADNPGILGAKLTFSFDAGLTLKSSKNGEAFSALSMTKPGKMTSPCSFTWDGQELEESDIKDGVILTLTFEVGEDVETGTDLNVHVSSDANGIVDTDLSPVTVDFVDGVISIMDYTPGDLNGDENIDITDVILMRRYIAGGYDITINESAADVNADDSINITDVILLRRYIAGGYDVELIGKGGHSKPKICEHDMEAVAAKNATCTTDGNIAYWHCKNCGKYYADAAGKTEITLASTVIKGSHKFKNGECEECGAKQDNCHGITYDIANGDNYLSRQAIANPNPSTYLSSDGLTLKSLSVPGYRFVGWYDGASSNAEQIKKIAVGTKDDIELYAHWEKITYTVQLKSDIFIDTNKLTYTVDTGVALPTPRMSNYVFTGWSDDDGNLYNSKTIPFGTTENMFLTANWTSERNKTYTKTELNDPIIYEDDEDKKIYFAYEIGEVQNVPISEIYNFGYIEQDGVVKTVTKTVTTEYQETLMQAFANSVSKATVQSSDWSLAEGWTENTYVDQKWATENDKSTTETSTYCKRDTSEWSVSSGTYGSTDITETDSSSEEKKSEAKIGLSTTDSTKVTDSTKESTKDTASLKTTLDIGTETTASIENSTTVGANFGVNAGVNAGLKDGIGSIGASAGAEAGVSASNTLKTGLSTTVSSDLSVEKSDTHETYSEKGHTEENGHEEKKEVSVTGSKGETNTKSNSATYTSGWNSTSSYGGSNEVSRSESATLALTEKITEETGYGESLSEEVKTTSSQGLSASNTSTDEYSSSVAYTTKKTVGTTETWTTMGTKAGYHRWIIAGTAHVFAVVTYDMKTGSYSVFTYSIMDDETHEFEDYSVSTANFDDHENGIISFSVPEYVMTYVTNRCSATRGLVVDQETGIITGYRRDNFDGTFSDAPGEYSVVAIPEYYNVGDGDVVKVTGISSNAFRNNTNIKYVILSDFITEIPDNAFEGCTNLVGVGAYCNESGNSKYPYKGSLLNKIGDNAFVGCVNFAEAIIPCGTSSIGENAFENVGKLTVEAGNADVAIASTKTGAKKIVLDLSAMKDNLDKMAEFSGKEIEISESVNEFTLNGYGASIENFSLTSNAKYTTINKTSFISSGSIPLRIASRDVILNQVSISSSGIGLVLTGETEPDYYTVGIPEAWEINLGLQGTVSVNSSGKYAILAKSLDLYESNNKVNGKLSTGSNTAAVCGTVNNISLFTGTIEYIDDETFERLLTSYKLTFDANGGTCSVTDITVTNSTAIGTLPEATSNYYDFVGWFTQKTGGEEVTSSTVYSDGQNRTLYAHWTPKTFTVTFDANEGTCPTGSMTASYNTALGELPTPTRDYYTFAGWYTAKEEGALIDSNSKIADIKNVTLYAHWTENAISGWVQESELPSGARVVDEKWSYTQRTNIESTNKSEDGYTLYDNYWSQDSSNSFNYASFPDGFDTGNWIYTSFHKSCDVSAYETETAKRTVSTSWKGYVYWKWDYNAAYSNNTGRAISPYRLNSGTSGYAYWYFHANLSSTNHPYLDNMYCNSYNMPSYNCSSEFNWTDVAGPTPRFFRFDYYSATYNDYHKVYKHYKVEPKESDTVVTAGDLITGVQKWVKYQSK